VAWIRELTTASHPDAVCVYVGDDVTDEDAFRAVRGHGIAVAASPRARGADYVVEGPPAVEELLRQIA
jgi:trehalose-6-phosphatase